MNIFTLNIHEEVIIDDRNTVMRVPGGWIYKAFSGQEKDPNLARPIGMVFVPYSDEFIKEAYEQDQREKEEAARAAAEDAAKRKGYYGKS